MSGTLQGPNPGAPEDPADLASTYLRLRPDARVELLPGGAAFWAEIASGRLGSFHNEYLVTVHDYNGPWPMWEMHPHGDEVVCLLRGALDFILEEPAGPRTVALRQPGQFVLVPCGHWHTARALQPSLLLFITAGEGTQHRPAAP